MNRYPTTTKLIAFVFLFLLTVKIGKTQGYEQKIKVVLLFKIAKNIEWQNENNIKEFNFSILTTDSSFVQEIKNVSTTYLLKNKKVKINHISNLNNINHTQLIFIGQEYNDLLIEKYPLLNKNNILFITESLKNHNFTMINLERNKENTNFIYDINPENIEKAGLNFSEDLLLFGGSTVNLKKLYSKKSTQLINQKDNYKRLENQLTLIKSEKDSIKAETQSLKQNIGKLLNNIKEKELKVEKLEDYIGILNKDIKQKDTILIQKSVQLNSFITETNLLKNKIDNAEKQLSKLDSSIVKNRKFINRQNYIISQQENTIIKKNDMLSQNNQIMKLQRIILFISIALGFLSLIIFYIYIKAYKTKKKLSENLEILVNEKTKELQKSQQHFKGLFESSPIGLLEIDLSEVSKYLYSLEKNGEEIFNELKKNGEITKKTAQKVILKNINTQAKRLFELEGKPSFEPKFIEKYIFNHLNDIHTQYKIIIAGQKYFNSYETERKINNSKKINVKINWVLLNEENKFSNILIAIQDITEIKRYEKELRNHKNHLEEIVIERTKEIQKLNDELFTNNENLTTKNFQLLNQQQRIKQLNNRLIDSNNDLQNKKEHLQKTIEQLQTTQKQLAQSEKMASIGLLTAGIAHELNNPMNFINVGNQVLKNLFAKISPVLNFYEKYGTDIYNHLEELKELTKVLFDNNIKNSIKTVLNNIDEGVIRSKSIIKGLTSYSKVDSDLPEIYDIKKAIQDNLLLLKNKYKERIDIIENYEGDRKINCFVGKINQLLLNILSNAIDAIEKKGKITIKVYPDKSKKNLIIVISDTGKGMTNDEKSKIFDPFFTTKKVGKGVGLGLYISYAIIQQHNGKIMVYSQKEKGSKFVVYLPKNLNNS